MTDLIENFLRKCGHHDKHFSKSALYLSRGYSWSGNIRYLETTVKIVAETTDEREISETRLRPVLNLDGGQSTISVEGKSNSSSIFFIFSDRIEGRFQGVVEDTEKSLIRYALDHAKNETQAAKFLGLSRSSLVRRIQEWGWDAAEEVKL